MDQHWIFELAERDPEGLLSMSDDEFRAAMADAGFDVDELGQQFALAMDAFFARLSDPDEP